MHEDEISDPSRVATKLKDLCGQAEVLLQKATSAREVDAVRVEFLGKKGHVSLILKSLGKLPQEMRRQTGKEANLARTKIESLLESHLAALGDKKRLQDLERQIDITLPGRKPQMGGLHPLTLVSDEILDVLRNLGFEIVHGPEIEHDFYNFEALNIPKSHPAREMQDTFYIDKDVVLRTHISPVQIRTMVSKKVPPIRVASAGRVFRRDQDVTHSPMFHQIEGLFVDNDVTFADLKGTLTVFAEKVFSPRSTIRMRPSYFPFTEPSVEVDVSCFVCDAKGCRLCQETGFIEILGAGMVDPEVFKATNMEEKKVSGFAFGIGVERVAMLKYGISDIRHFYENDLRFLSQFL